MFDYYSFNVTTDEEETYCKQTLQIKKFPIIRLFPFGKNLKLIKNILYPVSTPMKDIEEDLMDMTPDLATPIANEKEMMDNIDISTKKNRIAILFLYGTDKLPLSFKMIAKLSIYQ